MLLSVDEHIRLIVDFLELSGILENTIIMYTSDNGFQFGQHRIASDKPQLYEHDIRVPFIVRGPMFESGVASNQIVLNIDIAPMIVEFATTGDDDDDDDGDEPQELDMDGILFAPCTTPCHRRSDFLISYHGEGAPPCGWYSESDSGWYYQCPRPDIIHGGDLWNNTYNCVRTLTSKENSIYCEFRDGENFVEYYNMNEDEWQLTNKELRQFQKRNYKQRLAQLVFSWGETYKEDVKALRH